MSNQLFTLDYPRYPYVINLMDNPNLPVKEKFYSTDDNITSESDYSLYNSSADDNEPAAEGEETTDNSYV